LSAELKNFEKYDFPTLLNKRFVFGGGSDFNGLIPRIPASPPPDLNASGELEEALLPADRKLVAVGSRRRVPQNSLEDSVIEYSIFNMQ